MSGDDKCLFCWKKSSFVWQPFFWGVWFDIGWVRVDDEPVLVYRIRGIVGNVRCLCSQNWQLILKKPVRNPFLRFDFGLKHKVESSNSEAGLTRLDGRGPHPLLPHSKHKALFSIFLNGKPTDDNNSLRISFLAQQLLHCEQYITTYTRINMFAFYKPSRRS